MYNPAPRQQFEQHRVEREPAEERDSSPEHDRRQVHLDDVEQATGAGIGATARGRRSSRAAVSATNAPAAAKAPWSPSSETSGPATSEPITIPPRETGTARP